MREILSSVSVGRLEIFELGREKSGGRIDDSTRLVMVSGSISRSNWFLQAQRSSQLLVVPRARTSAVLRTHFDLILVIRRGSWVYRLHVEDSRHCLLA